jgi:hypothetical protein
VGHDVTETVVDGVDESERELVVLPENVCDPVGVAEVDAVDDDDSEGVELVVIDPVAETVP